MSYTSLHKIEQIFINSYLTSFCIVTHFIYEHMFDGSLHIQKVQIVHWMMENNIQFINIYRHTHICTHIYMHICTHIYMYICTHIYMHILRPTGYLEWNAAHPRQTAQTVIECATSGWQWLTSVFATHNSLKRVNVLIGHITCQWSSPINLTDFGEPPPPLQQ